MQKQQGFTLVEILIAMAIFGIIAAIALPSFKSSVNNSQVRSTSNELFGFLRFARSKAMQTGTTVVVTTLGNNGQPGTAGNTGMVAWLENGTNLVFNAGSDTELRRIRYEGDLNFKITPNLSAISFAGSGFLSNLPAGNAQLEIEVCIDQAGVTNKTITILQSGIAALNDGGSC